MFRSKSVITGIELGTSKICVLIGESDLNGNLSVVSHAELPSEGAVCKGEIADMDRATELLARVLEEADAAADCEIDPRNVCIAVTASDIVSCQGTGTVPVTDEDRKVKESHIFEASSSAQNRPLPHEQVVINSFDSYFLLDDRRRVLNPLDQVAAKLQAFVHIIYGDRNRLENFKSVVQDVGLDGSAAHLVFSGVASSYGLLTDDEKETGALLVEMGAGTTEYVLVFNHGILHSGVLNVGFEHVVNDMMLGLDLHISACRKLLSDRRYTLLRDEGASTLEMPGSIPGKARKIPLSSIEKIIDCRLRETFRIIKGELDERGLSHNLGTGIVFSGGAALFEQAQEVLANVFDAPLRVGKPMDVSGAVTDLESPLYSTSWGLLKYGEQLLIQQEANSQKGLFSALGNLLSGVSDPLWKLKNSLKF